MHAAKAVGTGGWVLSVVVKKVQNPAGGLRDATAEARF